MTRAMQLQTDLACPYEMWKTLYVHVNGNANSDTRCSFELRHNFLEIQFAVIFENCPQDTSICVCYGFVLEFVLLSH